MVGTMSSLPDAVQLVLGSLALIAMLAIPAAPELLRGWLDSRQEEERRAAHRDAELDRKIAIAEAAQAARARGETFTPPADYDRWA